MVIPMTISDSQKLKFCGENSNFFNPGCRQKKTGFRVVKIAEKTWVKNPSDKYTKDTSSDENASPWKSFGGQLSSWHNGSAGLMVLQAGLLALSVYGTDHDKLFSFENEENG